MPWTSLVTLEPEQAIPADALHTARDAVRRQFLESVAAPERPAVERLLASPHGDGRGLRMWLEAIVMDRAELPPTIPPDVIHVYLDNSDALPLHDCASCGFLVPIIAGREYDYEGEAEYRFFPACPNCGGRTGWYLFWAHAQPR